MAPEDLKLAGWRIPYPDDAHRTPLTSLSRLCTKGRVLGHKRAKRNTRPNTSLIQTEGVATKEDVQFYLAKRSRMSIVEGCRRVEGRVDWALRVLHISVFRVADDKLSFL